MSIISKTSKDWVYEQLNKDNPKDAPPFSAANLLLSAPAAAVITNRPDLNTVVTGSGINNVYVGKRPFNYRRIDLAQLFRGIQVVVQKYTAVVPSGAVRGTYSLYQLLPLLNAKYGVNLTTDDVVNVNFNILLGRPMIDGYLTHTLAVKAKPGSYAFVGTINVTWQNGPQSISELVLNRALPGRIYPGGNDFSGEHATIVNAMTFSEDYSALAASPSWSGYPNSVVKSNQQTRTAFLVFMYAIADEINLRLGTSIPKPSIGTGAAAEGYIAEVVTLPSTKYPEANSVDFNRCMVVTPPSTWGVGNLFIHYKV